jgi:uncharacterized protein YqeY
VAVKDQISADLKEAMKAKDQLRLLTLRSALSAFQYRKAEAGSELSDAEQLDVVRKLVKQRTDSIGEYEKAGRDDLAANEKAERDILAAYLPAQKSVEEIRATVREAVRSLAEGDRKEGSAMKLVMPKLKGEADGSTIRTVVLEELRALESA